MMFFFFGWVMIAAPLGLFAQVNKPVSAGRWPTEMRLEGGAATLDGRLFVTAIASDGLKLVAYRTALDTLILAGQKPISAPPATQPGAMALFNHWLFVGVNHPKANKDGRLLVFDVHDAQAMQRPPVFALDRKGARGFSTVDAVAVMQRNDHLVVALASEKCTTIEFFLSNGTDPSAPDFELKRWCQWDQRTADRKGWTDRNWNTYASLALFSFENELYLTGLGRDSKGKSVLDTYQISPKNDIFTLLKKTATRQADIANLNEPLQAFGIQVDQNGKASVIWARTVGQVIRFSADR